MQITGILQRLEIGDGQAVHSLMPLVYDELKKLAKAHLRRESRASSETTALVHDAYLKLSRGKHPFYENRGHFYGTVSRLMRQILVDAARSRSTGKRAAEAEIALASLPDVAPEPDRTVLAVDAALQQLEKADPRKGQLIQMRYFCGMTAEESATALSISVNDVRRELRLAQAWLRQEIEACPVAEPNAQPSPAGAPNSARTFGAGES